jgi:hypothetical protein
MTHRTNAATWLIKIEGCTGEPVDEFGIGFYTSPMPLGRAQEIAQNNLPCIDSRATIYSTVCHVDANGVTDLPHPPYEPRYPDHR